MAGLIAQHLRGRLSYGAFHDKWGDLVTPDDDDAVAEGMWPAMSSVFDYQPGGPTAIGVETGRFVRQCVALLRSDLDLSWRRVNVRRVHPGFICAVSCLAALGCAACLSVMYSWWIFAACWVVIGFGWAVEHGIRLPRRVAREPYPEHGPFLNMEQWQHYEHLAPSEEFPTFTDMPRSKFSKSALGRVCSNVLGPLLCCAIWSPTGPLVMLGYLWPDYDAEWYLQDDGHEDRDNDETGVRPAMTSGG
ncbi:MAG: hypothetical protein PVJ57_21750 [Phycisphaerae bacterium]|jgi:hypothetical protein